MKKVQAKKAIPLCVLLKHKLITLERYHELINDKINRMLGCNN